MKIWEIDGEVDDFATFFLENNSEVAILKENLNKGKPIEKWTSLNIEINEDDIDKPIGDMLHLWDLPGLIMISEKAKNILIKHFEEYIQFMPVFCKENNKNYYILNILNIIDCIDYEKSEFRKIELDNGDTVNTGITKYIFKENIELLPIFKIYLNIIINIDNYITDEFKKVIEDNELKGFKFTELFEFTH